MQRLNGIAAQLAQDPNLADIDVSYRPGRPEMQINIDRQRAGGFRVGCRADCGDYALARQRRCCHHLPRGRRRGRHTRAIGSRRANLGKKKFSMSILCRPAGNLVPLRNVATLKIATSPNSISRINRATTARGLALAIRFGARRASRPRRRSRPERSGPHPRPWHPPPPEPTTTVEARALAASAVLQEEDRGQGEQAASATAPTIHVLLTGASFKISLELSHPPEVRPGERGGRSAPLPGRPSVLISPLLAPRLEDAGRHRRPSRRTAPPS